MISSVELAAVAFGLVSIWLVRSQSVWCWPSGIVNLALQLVAFVHARLYADVGLQVVFIGLSVYGWTKWARPGEGRAELPVTRLSPRAALACVGLVAAAAALLGTVLARATDAALPYWNSTTTAMSLAAQLLMARKVLESWLLWIPADVLLVGIYLGSGLRLVAALYAVYLVLATLGFLAWRKSLLVPAAA